MSPNQSSHQPASYDLHNHTYWSFDGSVPVETHFIRARELGVRYLAITEHHHALSADEASACAKQYPDIAYIRSCEMTAQTSLAAVDLLCYGLPENPGPRLAKLYSDNLAKITQTAENFVNKANELGIPFGMEQCREALLIYRPGYVIDRVGISRVRGNYLQQYFMQQGWVNTVAEYEKVMDDMGQLKRPAWPSSEEVVAAVRESGGLIAIAHPPAYFDGADRKRMDALRAECDLDAIECAHPRISPELSSIYRAYCKEHKLLSTAGSDSHSYWDSDQRFGRHGGEELWIEEFLERLPPH